MKLVPSSQVLSFLLVLLVGCSSQNFYQQNSNSTGLPDNFGDYWYQGEAEITSFELKQARYGDYHEGTAVMIFVTEPFLTEKQVKADNPNDPNATNVLKLNFLRKFPTGIYDYSMMNSVFTPVNQNEFTGSLKLTGSSQDWCGQSFYQINQRNNQYKVQGFSYFESEGDQNYGMDLTYLEDELWTFLRINPKILPTGEVKIIPGVMPVRLSHKPLEPMVATVTMENYEGGDFPGDNLKKYEISYKNWDRSLKIIYEGDFPYKIAGWEDTFQSGFGNEAKKLTTKAVRKQTIKTDYWNRNAPEDSVMREELQIGYQ